jgi:CRISPR-associated protein Csb1
MEKRRIEGKDVPCVLLDSVQSQANRMEAVLEELWREARIALPVIRVDLSSIAPEIGEVTSLTAPHRVADALLRDSMDGSTLFRLSPLGRSFTDATIRNAAPLFKVCPTALLFGLWDSTGPKGGLGSKFARAMVAEIVGIGAVPGVRTSSRIDPTGIVTRAAEIYEAGDASEAWTHDPDAARRDAKGNAIKFGDGRVSEVNHSNVPPTLDDIAGGVTIDEARLTVVLSLAGLRKLGFGGGDDEARAVLAALGILAVIANDQAGHDLRSRCFLVPRPGLSLKLEAVRSDGSTQDLAIDYDGALKLYRDAVDALPESLRFGQPPGTPLATLTPSEKLAFLISRSRELAVAATGGEEE